MHDQRRKAGLYVHVPFCGSVCRYCDFYSKVANSGEIDDYLEALRVEASIEASGAFGKFLYDSVFLGGGTPSLLSPKQIEKLFLVVRSSFSVSDDVEITIECNPSTVTEKSLRIYRDSGINRISLGVQSFNDTHLERLGRLHDSKAATETFRLLRDAGFENIGIDLIYGLPEQTLHEWNDDLKHALALEPDHISAYNLIIESETPFGRLHAEGKLRLPSEDTQSLMHSALENKLTEARYGRYELSNYCKSGYECRHNNKYWRLQPYLGLGPAAVSFDGALRTRNLPDLTAYIKSAANLALPPRESELLDSDKLRAEVIMMQLRLSEGLQCEEIKARFQYDIIEKKERQIELLLKNGYITLIDGRIKLTPRALFISDEIIVKLI